MKGEEAYVVVEVAEERQWRKAVLFILVAVRCKCHVINT